ncbi:MAG: hypothetical protein ACI8XO_002584, partial [Verrucomicrobiales bacterium]
ALKNVDQLGYLSPAEYTAANTHRRNQTQAEFS